MGEPLLARLGLLDRLESVAPVYRQNAFIILATSGYTPVPYLLYTVGAGALEIPLVTFVAGSLAGRTLKYLPLLVLVYIFGPRARPILDRHARLITLAFVALVAVWIAVTWWR